MTLPLDPGSQAIDVIAFSVREQEFCVRTTSVREIRGWSESTPIPHAPPNILGVMNLRGVVIPIIDLAGLLGMGSNPGNERCAIVVADLESSMIGLVVDKVSDILTINANDIRPVPAIATAVGSRFARGVIAQGKSMTCFLDLSSMFTDEVVHATGGLDDSVPATRH